MCTFLPGQSSGDDVIDGGTAETISVTGYDGNDTITGSPGA